MLVLEKARPKWIVLEAVEIAESVSSVWVFYLLMKESKFMRK